MVLDSTPGVEYHKKRILFSSIGMVDTFDPVLYATRWDLPSIMYPLTQRVSDGEGQGSLIPSLLLLFFTLPVSGLRTVPHYHSSTISSTQLSTRTR